MTSVSRRAYLPVVLAVVAAFVAITASLLPATIATHFDGRGVPNGYMSRDDYRLFMLILTVALPLLVVGTITWLPRRLPRWTNIPHREYWLAPERREATFAFLAAHAVWLGCLMAFFSGGVHALVMFANAESPPRLANGPFFVLLGAFVVAIAAWIIVLVWRFRKTT